jgi:hypothetical protein
MGSWGILLLTRHGCALIVCRLHGLGQVGLICCERFRGDRPA